MLAEFCAVLALVRFGSCERHMRAEPSTHVSPILSIPAPDGVMSLKQMYLFAMDHSTGSMTATHMDGEEQLP